MNWTANFKRDKNSMLTKPPDIAILPPTKQTEVKAVTIAIQDNEPERFVSEEVLEFGPELFRRAVMHQ